MRRVRQHERAQIPCARRAEDAPAIPLRDETRQVTTMIEMGVCEDDGVDFRRVQRQRRPVSKAELLQSLEESAIDEDLSSVHVEEVLRAGDGTGCAQKRERRHRLTILTGDPDEA